MKLLPCIAFAALSLAASAAAVPAVHAQAPTSADSTAARAARHPGADVARDTLERVPAGESAAAVPPEAEPCPPPLLLDPSDMGFGASVVFTRIPNVADLHDLGQVANVQHVVLALPAWPAGWDRLQALQQTPLPEGADLTIVLPGYPPSRSAAEAWNYLRVPVRIVIVVDGPPADRGMIFELNAIRGLERVIADMERPSRSGFERLQRPLGFRVRAR